MGNLNSICLHNSVILSSICWSALYAIDAVDLISETVPILNKAD